MNFEKITNFIDASTKDIIQLQTLLSAHIAIAPESDGDGELEKCLALEVWLKEHGITNLKRFDAPDSRVTAGFRPNLVATIEGQNDDRTVWIMSHLDVVPIGERSLWNTDPWTVVEKDGKLYGRGVEDNQQGLCSGVFAALAYIKNDIKPQNTVKLLFVADEEVGSTYGIQYILNNHNLFRMQDLIIIPDAGDCKGETIMIAEKNSMSLKLTVHGKQAHASIPDEGINACLAGSALALSLNDMEKHFEKRNELFEPPYSTFQPTKREANVPNTNTIPGEDVFYMDCRVLPCYSLEDVHTEVKKRIFAIEKQYNVTIVCTQGHGIESPATPIDSDVVIELTAAIKKVHGITARPIGIGGGTVGGYLRIKGFNAAVWGTLEEKAHQSNEYCRLNNLIADAKVFASVFGGYAL